MAVPAIDFDTAVDEIARYIVALEQSRAGVQRINLPQGGDTALGDLIRDLWRQAGHQGGDLDPPSDDFARTVADAAAHLVRIGVLRLGVANPSQPSVGGAPAGHVFSVTQHGWAWAREASRRPPSDPGRFMAVMTPFVPRFGEAFRQRASEAAGCYRAGLYLAACVMAGAATESIVAALAVAQTGDPEAVRKKLLHPNRLISDVLSRAEASLASQVRVLAGVIGYLRNDAAHAVPTTISEPEASHALGQLMRLAMLVGQRWDDIT